MLLVLVDVLEALVLVDVLGVDVRVLVNVLEAVVLVDAAVVLVDVLVDVDVAVLEAVMLVVLGAVLVVDLLVALCDSASGSGPLIPTNCIVAASASELVGDARTASCAVSGGSPSTV